MSGSETKIVKAFSKLLSERPYGKITVKSIVETANLHRNTFYYHFSDIPALLDYMGDLWIDAAASKFAPADGAFCLEHAVTDFAAANKKQILNIYNSEARESLQHIMRKLSARLAGMYLDSLLYAAQISEKDRARLERFLSASICGVLTCWVADGMTYDIGADFKAFAAMVNNIYGIENARLPS